MRLVNQLNLSFMALDSSSSSTISMILLVALLISFLVFVVAGGGGGGKVGALPLASSLHIFSPGPFALVGMFTARTISKIMSKKANHFNYNFVYSNVLASYFINLLE
jgi:hypothetical protein